MSAPFPPVFSVQETSQRGQSLLQWRDGPGAAQLHSLQMPSDVAAFIVEACNGHGARVEALRNLVESARSYRLSLAASGTAPMQEAMTFDRAIQAGANRLADLRSPTYLHGTSITFP